ncbi:hypothetical protein H2198_010439 [Neophaeococcomyces mojaviensis]|uniref:Uncharacterized protein n=1 Tax=Neophaeococcomyces mojaviensis TaxID=3383035 RepID=A0ACC2ZRJ5_9EURO|nr:hypothetical protein H2198_010439 [Knufia sp. JES_112]
MPTYDPGFVGNTGGELGSAVAEYFGIGKTLLSEEGYSRSIRFVLQNKTNETLRWDGCHWEGGLWYPNSQPPSEIPSNKSSGWIAVYNQWGGGGTIEGSLWMKIDGGAQLNIDFLNKSLGDNTWRAYTNNESKYVVDANGSQDHDPVFEFTIRYK